MDAVWNTLCDAGLPDAAIRPLSRGALDAAGVHRAVEELAARTEEIPIRDAEPLLAWLAAWKHHWPRRFAAILGDAGEDLLARVCTLPVDRDRYLKLRRIAVEALAPRL